MESVWFACFLCVSFLLARSFWVTHNIVADFKINMYESKADICGLQYETHMLKEEIRLLKLSDHKEEEDSP